MTFRPGDRVLITKPIDIDQLPHWAAAMNVYDGARATITGIDLVSGWVRLTLSPGNPYGDEPFYFHQDWLTHTGALARCAVMETELPEDSE